MISPYRKLKKTVKLFKNKIQIAIDGPVAAGKGTAAKLLSDKLGVLYVDTGAMYRALTLFIKQHNIDWEEEEKICELLTKFKPQVSLEIPQKDKKDSRLVTVYLNNKDISWLIRTEKISWGVSTITRYKCVRDYMVPQQQKLAQKQGVVMEGRDITTRVLPKADLKIYLNAQPKERAKRRLKQLLDRGDDVSFEEVFKDLQKRDYQDSHRKIDPLTKTPDSWELDTTYLTILQVVDEILKKLQEKRLIRI